MTRPLRLALLQYPVERPTGLADWGKKLDRWLAEARAQGAELAVLPEYASVELGAALVGKAPAEEAEELAAMVAAADAILAEMRAAARRHGLWLQPGTLAMRIGENIINRAPLIDPQGRLAFQDKHAMTRFEAERWGVSPGAAPSVFDTPWGRIGISVCYDSEFPEHVRRQVEAGAWLVLVPSCTDTLHGFHRIRIAARARALENQCFVAICATVGEAPWSAALDVNRGLAGVYGPVDRGFAADGVVAEGTLDAAQWVYAELDPARIDTVRREGAVFNHRDWPQQRFGEAVPARFA